jgi:hypothetical protein
VQRQVVNLLAYAHERDVITEGCELSLDVQCEEGVDRIIIKDVIGGVLTLTTLTTTTLIALTTLQPSYEP